MKTLGRVTFVLAIATLSTAKADCLNDVQAAVHAQQVCLGQQKYASECNHQQDETMAQAAACHRAGLDGSLISTAMQAGAHEVHAPAEDSPYRQGLPKIEERNALLTMSEQRWKRVFGDILPPMNEDNFDSKDCPMAFEGAPGRFRMVGLTMLPVVERLGIYLGPAAHNITHMYLIPMQDKTCYGFKGLQQTEPVEETLPNQVDNLNNSDLAKLHALNLSSPSQAGILGTVHTHICSDEATCLTRQKKLYANWMTYQDLVRQVSAEEDCSRYAEANASGEINLSQINDMNCSAKDLKTNLARDQKQLHLLEASLYDTTKHP